MTASPAYTRRTLQQGQAWLALHDPGWGALRRAGRTALLMPIAFAFGDKVLGNPIIATFAAFGAFAMLLLVDFTGPLRDRVLDQAALGIACGVLISLATLVSQTTWEATAGMAIVALVILFAGIVSSVLAGATTPLLLAFILPVSLAGPASTIPDRVAGWGLAALVSLPAIAFLWPAPVRNPLRTAAIDALRALAHQVRSEVAFVMSAGAAASHQAHRAAVADAQAAGQRLQDVFFATPYRPTGLTTDARAVIRLVDELRWLSQLVLRATPAHDPPQPSPRVCGVKSAAADVLGHAADLLADPERPEADLDSAINRLAIALDELEATATRAIPAPEDGNAPANGTPAARIVSALDPSFRSQELTFVVSQVARNVQFAAAATRRSWLDRVLGHQPAGLPGPLASARSRASAHVDRSSVWLHNSLRGAAALGLAVLVADLSGVQHGFWVVFGTLSVLRSNALNTGQNILRALAGTTAGFIVGGALVTLIGTNTAVLWALLPVVILLAGLAPSTVSFTAGQAAFTLTLLILFNIIAPAGWRIGLVRVEDIALGGAVSLAVGLLFWPRGAASTLRRALAQGYEDAASYLSATVTYGLSRCERSGSPAAAPRAPADRAAASARRLDDTFRSFLAERGAKPVALREMTRLVSGVAGVRLAADAVLDLWEGHDPGPGDRTAARRELMNASLRLNDWFDHFASSLDGREQVPRALAPDAVADGQLVSAVDRDLRDGDGAATRTGVRVIWTGDHLDAARRLQQMLVEPAETVLHEHALTGSLLPRLHLHAR